MVNLDGITLMVSTAEGLGKLMCSYRYRVPIHPYFYEAGELLENLVPTCMMHDILDKI